MDIPFVGAGVQAGQAVAHQDRIAGIAQVPDLAPGHGQLAAVRGGSVALDEIMAGLGGETGDLAVALQLFAVARHQLALAAVEGDRVLRAGLVVPVVPVGRAIPVVPAGLDQQRLAGARQQDTVLVAVAVVERAIGAGLEIQRAAPGRADIGVHRGPADARIIGRVGRRRLRLGVPDRHRIRRLQQAQRVFGTAQVGDIPGRARRHHARTEGVPDPGIGPGLGAVAEGVHARARRRELGGEVEQAQGPGLGIEIHARGLRHRIPQRDQVAGRVLGISGAIGVAALLAAPGRWRVGIGAEREVEPLLGSGDIAQRQG